MDQVLHPVGLNLGLVRDACHPGLPQNPFEAHDHHLGRKLHVIMAFVDVCCIFVAEKNGAQKMHTTAGNPRSQAQPVKEPIDRNRADGRKCAPKLLWAQG